MPTSNQLGQTLYALGLVFVLSLLGTLLIYGPYVWETSPTEPTANHTELVVEHGQRRYFTPWQSTVLRTVPGLCAMGLVVCIPAAHLLRHDEPAHEAR